MDLSTVGAFLPDGVSLVTNHRGMFKVDDPRMSNLGWQQSPEMALQVYIAKLRNIAYPPPSYGGIDR